MIFNKSTHPVEVKKISIRLWSLRDEIEAALSRRMKECEASGVPLYIDDIKEFYHKLHAATQEQNDNVLELNSASSQKDPLEGIADDMPQEEAAPEPEPEAEPEAQEAGADESMNNLMETVGSEAKEVIEEQKLQGLDTTKPNPVIARPFVRQPPDMNKMAYGFTLLSDIHMEAMLCFTKENFLQGQSVVIEFLIPQNFMMTAEVIYCHNFARTSRVISSTKPDFRIQCKFNFSISGERSTLRNFLKSVEPTIVEHKKKAPKKEVEEEDSLDL